MSVFIAIEGIDYTGKSTIAAWMADWFEQHGVEVVRTREPGGTPAAEKIRNLLLSVPEEGEDDLTPMAEVLLFTAARNIHLTNHIQPALEAGKMVISDRFVASTYAYQGGGRGVNVGTLSYLHKLTNDDRYPDITFLMDGDPEKLLERSIGRGGYDRIEQEGLAFQQRCREIQKDICAARQAMQPDSYVIIDAEQDLDSVKAQFIPHLMKINNRIRQRPTAVQ